MGIASRFCHESREQKLHKRGEALETVWYVSQSVPTLTPSITANQHLNELTCHTYVFTHKPRDNLIIVDSVSVKLQKRRQIYTCQVEVFGMDVNLE